MVMAGGTGRHAFPGLAVVHHLITQGWQVRWPGIADRMGADLVLKHGIEIDFTRISSLRGKGIRALIAVPLCIFNAWYRVRAIMKAYKSDVALGMDGYVSGPSGLAVWSLGIPVMLREQNGTTGLANRRLAKIAIKVTQAFPGALPNTEVVGNPVHTDVLVLLLSQQRLVGCEDPVRVSAMGGPQGARILSQTMPQAAAKLGDSVTIWYQGGKSSQQPVEQAYAKAGQPQHKVTEFIDDVAAAYVWADVIVRRSSALAMSEIAVAGLPALFVPFQHKDRKRYRNALPLEKAGVAKIIERSQFSVDAVVNTLAGQSRETLLAMAERARAVSILDAIERMVNEVSRAARAQLQWHLLHCMNLRS